MSDFDTEWQKMLDGEVYDAGRREFLDRLIDTRERLWEFNNMDPRNTDALTLSLIHISEPTRH